MHTTNQDLRRDRPHAGPRPAHGLDLYWVDAWDDEAQEPVAVAVKLADGIPDVFRGNRLAEASAELAAHRHGGGELVLLDRDGRRRGRRVPVADVCGAAA